MLNLFVYFGFYCLQQRKVQFLVGCSFCRIAALYPV